jgi:release factor glutamine methyltransferase
MIEEKFIKLAIAKIKDSRYENLNGRSDKMFLSKLNYCGDLDKDEQALLQNMLARYRKNEPVSKIINCKSFWKHDFFVNENVLDPRPETELIIETMLKRFDKNAALRFLDIGTGSGCILLSLLWEFKNAMGIGIDVSAKAIQVAEQNKSALKVNNAAFLNIDWNELSREILTRSVPFDGVVDIIVSNPPYVRSSDVELLDDNVKNYDPILALDGGKDGLSAYREIIKIAKEILAKNGSIFFEVGYDQANDVKKILTNNGFENIRCEKDLSGIDRVVFAETVA